MTNEEIQKHIEQNCRYPDGTPAMDEQAFYEGVKWMRDQALRIHDVVGQSEQLARKSCHHACGPSDYYKGGKCDKMGCYEG